MRNFAVKLLTNSDTSFRGEYLNYNLGTFAVSVVWLRSIAWASEVHSKAILIATNHRNQSHFYYVHTGKVPRINCSKATSAGMTLRPPVQTIIDTVRYDLGGLVVDCRNPQTLYALGRN